MREDGLMHYLDIPGVIVLSLDREGNVTYINARGCKMLGYTPKYVMGKNWFDNFLPEQAGREAKKFYLMALKSKRDIPADYENPILCKDGKEVIILWHNIILRDSRGKPSGGLSSGVDITGRKDAERALSARYKYDKLRAEIWKAASDKTIDQDTLIKRILNAAGPVMGVDRACFNSVDRGKMTCTLEWKLKSVKSSLGGGVPVGLVEKFISNKTMVYSVEKMKKSIPSIFSPVTSPLVDSIFRKFNVRSILGVPVYSGKKMAGTVTLNICSTNTTKHEWLPEDYEIIEDIRNIISSAISLRAAESEASEKGSIYSDIFNGTAEMMCLIKDIKPGRQARIAEVNDTVLKRLGYTRDELIGAGSDKMFPGKMFGRELKKNGYITLEQSIRAKSGELIPAEVTVKLLSKDPAMAVVSGTELTERKREQKALAESEARFKALYENAPEAYLMYDSKGVLTGSNKAAEELTGYRASDNIGKSLFRSGILLKEDYPIMLKNMALRLLGKDLGVVEYRFRHKNGEIVPVELIARPITMSGKKYLLAFVRDLRQRKKAEELLKAGEEKFKQIFEYAPDAYYIIDSKGVFVEGNLAAEKMIGYARKDLIGKNLFNLNLVSPDQFPRATRDIIKNLSGKSAGPTEYLLNRRDGTKVWVEAMTYPIKRDGRIVLLGIARDITSRKKDNEEKEVMRIISELFLEVKGLDQIFSELPQIIAGTFGYSMSAVVLYDEKNDEVLFVGNEGIFDNNEVLRAPASTTMAGTVIKTGKPLLIRNIVKRKDYTFEKLKEKNAKVFLGVPIRNRKKAIGALVLADVKERPDSEKVFSLLQAIGNYLSQEISRRRSEEALKLSEEKFRNIANYTHDWEYWVDENNRFIYCSPSCERITGYKPEEFISDPELRGRIVHPEYRDVFMRHLAGRGRVKSENIDYKLIRKDGREIWMNHLCIQVFDSEGNPAGRRGSDRDVTERVIADRIMKESEMKFRGLFNNASDAIFLHTTGAGNMPGHFIEVNDAACARLGYTRDEIFSMSPAELDSPEYAKNIPGIMVKLERTGHATFESEHMAKDGRKIPVEISAHIFEMGGDRMVVSLARDITDRKKAEESLREKESRFRAIFEQAAVGMAYIDLKGNFIAANEKLCRITGYSLAEITALNSAEITHPDDVESDMENIRKLIDGSLQNFSIEKRYIRKEHDEVWVKFTGALVKDVSDRAKYIIGVIEDISLKKYTENALKENEEKYRSLFENMKNGFAYHKILLDKEGTPYDYEFLEINRAFEQMTGFKRENVLGRKVTDVIPGILDDVFDWVGNYAGVAISGHPLNFESYNKPLDKWFSVAAYSNKKNHFATIFTDITEKKKTEEKIMKLSAAVEQSGSMVLITDTEGVIEYVNPKFTDITGYEQAETLGKKPNLLKSGYFSAGQYKELWETIKSGKVWRGQFHNKKKNGSLYWESASISPIKNAEGVIMNFIAIKEDITAMKEAEAQLTQSRDMLFDFLENANDMIQIIRPDYTFEYVNKKWMDTLGYAPDKLFGMTIFDIIIPAHREGCRELFSRIMKGEKAENIDTVFLAADGREIIVEGNANLFVQEGEVPQTRAIFRDVTEKRLAENNLKANYEKLKELDIMKSNFTAMVSHELRTPLTSIKGFSSFLQGGVGGTLSPKQLEFVDIIRSNSDRLLNLINEILDISKVESGTFSVDKQLTNIVFVVDKAINDMSSVATRQGISVAKDFKKEIIQAKADEYRVSQVVINLLNNAIKFSPEKSTITVGADIVPHDRIKVPAYAGWMPEADKKYALIWVKDEGKGIAAENLSKVFDRFFQVSDKDHKIFKGVGLGLNITKAIVEAHNGAVWAESGGHGKGSEFYVMLPIL